MEHRIRLWVCLLMPLGLTAAPAKTVAIKMPKKVQKSMKKEVAVGSDKTTIQEETMAITVAQRSTESECSVEVTRDIVGNTKLHYAAQCGDAHMLNDVMSPRSIDMVNSLGETALHITAARSDATLTAMLLNAGAKPTIADNNGFTPLHNLARVPQGLHICAYVLLNAGADPEVVTHEGLTPLHLLVGKPVCGPEDVSIAELLVTPKTINAQDHEGATPLIRAVRARKEEMCRFLIGQSANVHIVDNQGKTALAWALLKQHQGIIDILQRSGAY